MWPFTEASGDLQVGLRSGSGTALASWLTSNGLRSQHEASRADETIPSGIDAAVKLRPTGEELNDIGPEFAEYWQRVFANAPDKPVCWLECVSMCVGVHVLFEMHPPSITVFCRRYVGDHSTIPARKYFSMGHIILYPEAVGYVHISSAEDADASQDFDPKYLSKSRRPSLKYSVFHSLTDFLSRPSDIAALRWAYKRGREASRRMASYRGEYAPCHPVFPKDSQAACNDDAKPVPMQAPDIVYTEEDNKALDEYLRKFVQTCWH